MDLEVKTMILEEILKDFALDVIHNVVELKDPKTGATEYDEIALEEFIVDYGKTIERVLEE